MKKLNFKSLPCIIHLNDIQLLYDSSMFEEHAHIISAGIVLADEYIMNKEIVKYR